MLYKMHFVQQHASRQLLLQPRISYDLGKRLEELDNNRGAMQTFYQKYKAKSKVIYTLCHTKRT